MAAVSFVTQIAGTLLLVSHWKKSAAEELRAYYKLKEMVDNGEVVFTYIDSNPRASSTAVAVALSQSPDIDAFAMEPINYYLRSTQGMLELLLIQIDELRRSRKSQTANKRPLHILVKCIACTVPDHSWDLWMDLVSHFILLKREPQAAAHSFLEQKSSDRSIFGFKNVPRPITEKVLLAQDAFTSLSGQGKFRSLGWSALEYHRTKIEDHIQEYNHKTLISIDANVFRASPKSVLRQIASNSRIKYTDAMVSGWTRNTGRDLSFAGIPEPIADYVRNTGWFNEVAGSTGIKRPSRNTSPAISAFSKQMQEYLFETGLPAYARFLAHHSTWRPRSFSESFAFVARPLDHGGHNFMNIDPILSYALIYLSKPENAVEAEERETELQQMVSAAPPYAESFKILERHFFG